MALSPQSYDSSWQTAGESSGPNTPVQQCSQPGILTPTSPIVQLSMGDAFSPSSHQLSPSIDPSLSPKSAIWSDEMKSQPFSTGIPFGELTGLGVYTPTSDSDSNPNYMFDPGLSLSAMPQNRSSSPVGGTDVVHVYPLPNGEDFPYRPLTSYQYPGESSPRSGSSEESWSPFYQGAFSHEQVYENMTPESLAVSMIPHLDPTIDCTEAYPQHNELAVTALPGSLGGERKKRQGRKNPANAAKYKCDECGMRFTRNSNCRSHTKIHDPHRKFPHVCPAPSCTRKFSRKTDLVRHIDSVSTPTAAVKYQS